MNLDYFRKLGKINRDLIKFLAGICVTNHNTTTASIDLAARDFFKLHKVKSGVIGYKHFPGHVCISINDEVVHGFGKDDIQLKPGDVVTLDCVTKGHLDDQDYYVDAADTFIIPGEGWSEENAMLINALNVCLSVARSIVEDGARLIDIAQACDAAADHFGLRITPQFSGHGIGNVLHKGPYLLHTVKGIPGHERAKLRNTTLTEGDLICVEPIGTFGSLEMVLDPDKWTYRAKHGNIFGHIEKTLLVTKEGCEVIS